jgi:UDP-hydrolysing UDP-N-acetyl-D-glucosamine 2-epimerase
MRLGLVTVSRSDFGIYQPLLLEAAARADIDLQLIAAGMHLAPEFGLTLREIEHTGYSVVHKVEMLLSSDTPEGTAKSMGVGIIGFSQLFAANRLDWLVVLGDRFEMFAAVVAALPFRIPVAHIHGGELTLGAIDDAMRHSITKMSHLHFVSTQEYARRVEQLGEEPWRVTHCGALSLENVTECMPTGELERRFSLNLETAPLLVTFHPSTLHHGSVGTHLEELLGALAGLRLPCVFTLPNADANGRQLAQRIRSFVNDNASYATLVDNFGRAGYFGMLRDSSALVGNSSSGIIEACSFKLPVVNIGDRQAGRVRSANVIDVPPKQAEIRAAICKAISAEFREACKAVSNPYAPPAPAIPSKIILERIVSQVVDARLIMKRFYEPRGVGA